MRQDSVENKVLRGEYPQKEEFVQYYLTENHSQMSTAEHFGISRSVVQSLVALWGVSKDVKQFASVCASVARTNSKSVHQKVVSGLYPGREAFEKYYLVECHSRKETAEHFGISESAVFSLSQYFNLHKSRQEITDTRKHTCVSRYGFDSNLQSPIVKDQIKNTCLQKYGVEHVAQAESVKEKVRQTMMKNHGVEFALQNADIRERSRQTCRQRYGVDWSCQLDACRSAIYSKNSRPNLRFAEKLSQNNIAFTQEFVLGKYSFDFKIDNVLVEIDPWYTHQSTVDGKFGKKDPKYHADKTMAARQAGYRCIHVFDWDDADKIVHMLSAQRNRCFARSCRVQAVTVDEERTFLGRYHLQGYIKSEICLGLYLHDNLVALMSFGRPRYNKKYQYELLRFCVAQDVIGGAEKLFAQFLRDYKPTSIISYCDLSKFEGNVYQKLGFSLLRTAVSKHWYSPRLKKHVTDNLLRAQGFDRLLGGVYGCYGHGTDNESLMLEHGFVEIYDAGQATYIYIKK